MTSDSDFTTVTLELMCSRLVPSVLTFHCPLLPSAGATPSLRSLPVTCQCGHVVAELLSQVLEVPEVRQDPWGGETKRRRCHIQGDRHLRLPLMEGERWRGGQVGLWGPGGSSGTRRRRRRGSTVGQLDWDHSGGSRAAGRSTVRLSPPGGSGRGCRLPTDNRKWVTVEERKTVRLMTSNCVVLFRLCLVQVWKK